MMSKFNSLFRTADIRVHVLHINHVIITWRYRSGSPSAQVMAWCLMAPSHYLNQCWLIISKVHQHSAEGNFTRDNSSHESLKLAWKLLKFHLPFWIQDNLVNLETVLSLQHVQGHFLKSLLNQAQHSILSVAMKSINTLRPRQNGRRFTDDTFKRIFLNENVRISIKISLKFVPKGPINNIPALVQIMAWHRSGDKPLSEPMMVSLLTYICVTRPQWVNSQAEAMLIYHE